MPGRQLYLWAVDIKYMYMTPQQQRGQQALAYLKQIQSRYSTVYFVGLLMGIISRLAIKDYDLMHELKQRSEQTNRE